MPSDSEKKRAHRARRAIEKSLILTPWKGEIFEFPPAQYSTLLQILREISPSRSPEQQAAVLRRVSEMVGQLISSRTLDSNGASELRRIRRLWEATVELNAAWADFKSDKVLWSFLRSEVAIAHLAETIGRKPEQLEAIAPSVDRYISSTGDDLRSFLKYSKKILFDSVRISNYAEYKFVWELTVWWLALGSGPTLTRNTEASEFAPKTTFQRFVECAVPKPAISDETMRSVLDAVAEWLTRSQKPARKNPKERA